MFIDDFTRDDFEDLRKEASRVNSELQSRAGWKGRLVEFKFDAPGAYYMEIGDDSITVLRKDREMGRISFSERGCDFSGKLFGECNTAQEVARAFRSCCLEEENVEDLRRNTFGCCEVIPFINQTGFADPNDVHVLAFFPKERFDITNALVYSGLSFSVKDISEYPDYCRRNLERLSKTGVEQALTNDFARTSYLYDGKKFHKMGMARHLSGELQKGMRNGCVDTMRRIEIEARSMKYSLQQSASGVEKQLPAVVFANAVYPLVGDGSVFLVSEGKPTWGVYLNAEGRISVCDGRGWEDYPKRARFSDLTLETLLNSSEKKEVSAGIRACCAYMNSQCMNVENVMKAGEDIDSWLENNEKELTPDGDTSKGMKR